MSVRGFCCVVVRPVVVWRHVGFGVIDVVVGLFVAMMWRRVDVVMSECALPRLDLVVACCRAAWRMGASSYW